jgi:hypothetical protein
MKSIGLAFLLLFAQIALAQETRYLLSDYRPKIAIPEYSKSQKQIVVEQALRGFRAFNVNEDIKNRIHTNIAWNQNIIDTLESNYSEMSSSKIIHALSRLYLGQFDDHLNFAFPAPHQCFYTELPLRLKPIEHKGYTNLRISSLRPYKVVDATGSELGIPGFDRMTVGDQLLSVDGKTLSTYIKDLQTERLFPVASFRLRQLGNYIIYRNHRLRELPSQDTSTLRFQKNNGEIYDVELNWLVSLRSNCLGKERALAPVLTDEGSASEAFETTPDHREMDAVSKAESAIEWVKPYSSALAYGWGYFTENKKRYGYFKLGTFSPQVEALSANSANDSQMMIHEFRKIWTKLNNDPTIRGLIIDVRENTGGSLILAANMVKSFTSGTVESTRYRYKNTDENRMFIKHLVQVSGLDYFQDQLEALQAVEGTSRKYSGLVQLFPLGDTAANTGEQVFYKPTVIFTNSICYSSCDSFTALMQDHGAAFVVGEDAITGGGGANVWTHSNIIGTYGPLDLFKELPFKGDLRFPLRQILRTPNPRLPLEDVGVRVDRIYPTTLNDLASDSRQQLVRISQIIDRQVRPSYPLVPVDSYPNTYQEIQIGQPLPLEFAIITNYGLSKDAVTIDGTYLEAKRIDSKYKDGVLTRVSLPIDSKSSVISKLDFKAKLQTEACCDKVYIGYRQGNSIQLLHFISGSIDGPIEVKLPNVKGKFELHIWFVTNWATNAGLMRIEDLILN